METNAQVDHVADANGNKCYIQYFGSLEAAQKALDSLKECRNCINCSGCSGCSDCSGCSGCSGCSDCSDCSGCSGCSELVNVRNGVAPSSEVPVIEDIHTKVFEAVSKPGALDMGDWHRDKALNEEGAYCGTTHCRAGWVVALAGRAGRALELFHDTPLAAQLIYAASSPHKVSPPRFYETNAVAMEDMRRLAELEAAGKTK